MRQRCYLDTDDKMPVADDWRTTPLSTVDTMFTATQGVNWEAAVDAFFAERLSTDDDLALIPALNDVSHAQNLVDGQLVTFRCMVQVRESSGLF